MQTFIDRNQPYIWIKIWPHLPHKSTVIFAIGFIVVWTIVKPLLLAWAAERKEKARQAQGLLAKLVV